MKNIKINDMICPYEFMIKNSSHSNVTLVNLLRIRCAHAGKVYINERVLDHVYIYIFIHELTLFFLYV